MLVSRGLRLSASAVTAGLSSTRPSSMADTSRDGVGMRGLTKIMSETFAHIFAQWSFTLSTHTPRTTNALSVADLEGASTPPLGDGQTSSLTVLLICDNGTVLWRHHRQLISSNTVIMLSFALRSWELMLNFDRSTVKHGTTHNIQNDCHQCSSSRWCTPMAGYLLKEPLKWLLTALECAKFVFGRGCARTPWESLQRSPRLPSLIKGAYLQWRGRGKGRERERREKEGGKRRGNEGMEGEGTAPLTQIPGSAPTYPNNLWIVPKIHKRATIHAKPYKPSTPAVWLWRYPSIRQHLKNSWLYVDNPTVR